MKLVYFPFINYILNYLIGWFDKLSRRNQSFCIFDCKNSFCIIYIGKWMLKTSSESNMNNWQESSNSGAVKLNVNRLIICYFTHDSLLNIFTVTKNEICPSSIKNRLKRITGRGGHFCLHDKAVVGLNPITASSADLYDGKKKT